MSEDFYLNRDRVAELWSVVKESLSGKVDISVLDDYATENDVNEAISEALIGYAKTSDISDAISIALDGYVNLYTHNQDEPSPVWTIQHGLGKRCPNIVLIDKDGNRIFGETNYYSENLTIVTFNTAISGSAYLS